MEAVHQNYIIVPSSQEGWWPIYDGGKANDANCKLLIHSDTTDASTTFTDSSTGGGGRTVTANGNVQHDTAQKKWGATSMLFDGTGDYLSCADHADWDFDTGDFTIDCWVRLNQTAATQIWGIFGQYVDVDNFLNFYVYYTASAYSIRFYAKATPESTAVIIYSDTTTYIQANKWIHIAICLDASADTYYLFANGKLLTLATNSNADDELPNLAAGLTIGRWQNAPGNIEDFNGHIDELRVIKGYAAYTKPFIPCYGRYR